MNDDSIADAPSGANGSPEPSESQQIGPELSLLALAQELMQQLSALCASLEVIVQQNYVLIDAALGRDEGDDEEQSGTYLDGSPLV